MHPCRIVPIDGTLWMETVRIATQRQVAVNAFWLVFSVDQSDLFIYGPTFVLVAPVPFAFLIVGRGIVDANSKSLTEKALFAACSLFSTVN